MRIDPNPLNETETRELTELLAEVAGRTLVFARGVFAAAATAPVQLDPTEWLPLLLASDTPPGRESLERLFDLMMREYNACSTCLGLGVPAVPAAAAAGEQNDQVVDFCRGYVRLMQSVQRWTRDPQAFELSAPFAVLAGYVGPEALSSFDPGAAQNPEAWRAKKSASLSDDVALLYAYWAEARQQPTPAAKPAEDAAASKVGRNDLCPCGSGKKYKKCCAS